LPFYLDIRHTVESADELSGDGEALYFDQRLVRVGSGAGCECRIPDSELEDVHFLIVSESEGTHHALCPGSDSELFLNRTAVTAECELRSGDEVRVGHWVFRFVRVYAHVRQARRSDALALVAKILVGAILFSEIGVVAWLPRWLRSSRLWSGEVSMQRTTYLLDGLRVQNSTSDSGGELEKSARDVIQGELDALARFIRRNDESLSRAQWEQISADLRSYQRTMKRLEDGTAFKPVPSVDVDGAVRAALGYDHKSEENGSN